MHKMMWFQRCKRDVGLSCPTLIPMMGMWIDEGIVQDTRWQGGWFKTLVSLVVGSYMPMNCVIQPTLVQMKWII